MNLRRFLFWKKNKKAAEKEKLPEKLELAMGGKPEGDFNGVKTDYTDDFKFGEVWIAVKDKKLYKY